MKKRYLLILLLVLVFVGCGKKEENKDEIIKSRLIEEQTYQQDENAVGSAYGNIYTFFEDGTYYYFHTEYGYTEKVDTPCNFIYGKWKVKNQELLFSDIKALCYKDVTWNEEDGAYYPKGTIISESKKDTKYTINIKEDRIGINGDNWYKVGILTNNRENIEKIIKEGKVIPKVDDMGEQ